MKKLRKLSISENKIMKNEELINMRGGYDPGSGTCAWDGYYGFYTPLCNVSRYYAETFANTYGGRWCCDHCYIGGTYGDWWAIACG